LKSAISRILLKIPYGIDIKGFDEDVFNQLIHLDSDLWSQLEQYTDRTVLGVNKFNAKRVLEEKYEWEADAFNKQYLNDGILNIKTSHGMRKLTITSLTEMLKNLITMSKAGDLKQTDDKEKVEYIESKASAEAMTLFIIGTCSFKIEDGKYKIPPQPFKGDPKIPDKWRKLAVDLLLELNGRVPRYNDKMGNIAASVYSDIFDYLPENLDAMYTDYTNYANQKEIENEQTTLQIQALANEYANTNRPPGYFQEMKTAERRSEDTSKSFVKDMKKHYKTSPVSNISAPIGDKTGKGVGVWYYYSCALKNIMKRNIYEKPSKGETRLVIFGDSVGNSITPLEVFTTLTDGPTLFIDFESTAQHSGRTKTVKLDKVFEETLWEDEIVGVDNHQRKSTGVDVFFFEGYGIIKTIDRSVPIIDEQDTTDDRKILEIMRRFSLSSACAKGDILLCAHNIPHEQKFEAETQYIKSLGLWATIIPFPAADSSSFVWAVYGPSPDKLQPNIDEIYDFRIIECKAKLKMYEISRYLGRPGQRKGHYTDQYCYAKALRLGHYVKVMKRAAKKGRVSGQRPNAPVDKGGWKQLEKPVEKEKVARKATDMETDTPEQLATASKAVKQKARRLSLNTEQMIVAVAASLVEEGQSLASPVKFSRENTTEGVIRIAEMLNLPRSNFIRSYLESMPDSELEKMTMVLVAATDPKTIVEQWWHDILKKYGTV